MKGFEHSGSNSILLFLFLFFFSFSWSVRGKGIIQRNPTLDWLLALQRTRITRCAMASKLEVDCDVRLMKLLVNLVRWVLENSEFGST